MAKSRSTTILSASFAAVAVIAAASAPAMAQTTGSQVAQTTTTQGQQSENLSSQLSKSGGVITPKSDVDPAMHVPAPDPHPNSTPVIPPSATGGNSAK